MKSRVLIVDDSRNARRALAALLADEGYETLHVPDDHRARDAVVHFRPDVVIADMWMPGMEGLKLLRFLPEERRPGFIVVSSFASFRESARQAGAAAFLLKPVNLDTLLASIEAAIGCTGRDAQHPPARRPGLSPVVLPR